MNAGTSQKLTNIDTCMIVWLKEEKIENDSNYLYQGGSVDNGLEVIENISHVYETQIPWKQEGRSS